MVLVKQGKAGGKRSCALPTGRQRRKKVLLHDLLLAGFGVIILAGFVIGGCDAEGFLQPLAGPQAVAAAVALGLDSGLTRGRDHHFNDASHRVSPR
jgi:hypothetical protein